MDIIEFKQVFKSFGQKDVLKDTSLSVKEGETITILGGSGTGKSVFLKLLLGVMKPDEGEIFYRGENIVEMNEQRLTEMRKKIGMLFQGAALLDSLSVRENVAYPLRQHFKLKDDELEQRVQEKLSLVGLPDSLDLYPSELSGGMKKRVGLARAIATDPEIILYDEPTGLDPANTKRINHLIKELQKKLSVTSIAVTHDIESAFFISDRFALLKNHSFRFVGTKEEAKHSTDEVVQGFLNGELEE